MVFALSGYAVADPGRLADDMRSQLLPLDAAFEETTKYGDKYRITGTLTGPNGRRLSVVSIWMIERTGDATVFITLHPAKEN